MTRRAVISCLVVVSILLSLSPVASDASASPGVAPGISHANPRSGLMEATAAEELDESALLSVENCAAYIAGARSSLYFPTTPGALDPTFDGDETIPYSNGFVSKMDVISPVPPVADAGGPYNVDEGGTVLLNGSGSSPTGSVLAFAWDLDSDGNFETPGQKPTLSAASLDGPITKTVTLRVTDTDVLTATSEATVNVLNVAPTVSIKGAPATAKEGTMLDLTCKVGDPGKADTFSYDWSVTKDGSPFASGTSSSFSFTPTDNGTYVVNLTVTDDDGGRGKDNLTTIVSNAPPVVATITGPSAPVPLYSTVNLSAGFTDPGSLDTHKAIWGWGDGRPSRGRVSESNGSGSASGRHIYASPGVYGVKLKLVDKDGAMGMRAFRYIVVYNPATGSVSGSGWINSPAGAYVPDPYLTAKAWFGFVARYEAHAPVPTGNMPLTFQVANLSLSSIKGRWLGIVGPKARYWGSGSGSINGGRLCGFLLTINDGQMRGGGGVDRFRIKIWDRASGEVIYDNQMGAANHADATRAIAGGSIIIRK